MSLRRGFPVTRAASLVGVGASHASYTPHPSNARLASIYRAAAAAVEDRGYAALPGPLLRTRLAAPINFAHGGARSTFHTSAFSNGGGASPTPSERVSHLLRNVALALGLGVGIYVAVRRDDSTTVPASVAELCSQAGRLRAEGAPLSAAAKYEAAFNVLTATSSGGDRDTLDPIITAELLLQWGEAQREARAWGRAAVTLTRARVILTRLLETSSRERILMNEVPRKQAVILDALADLEREAGRPGPALAHLNEAVRLLDDYYPSLGHAASSIAHSGDDRVAVALLTCREQPQPPAGAPAPSPYSMAMCRKERWAVADAAGVHHNRSELLLEGGRTEEAVAAANRALALVAAARVGAVRDAEALVPMLQLQPGASPPPPQQTVTESGFGRRGDGRSAIDSGKGGGGPEAAMIRRLRALDADGSTTTAVRRGVTSAASAVGGGVYRALGVAAPRSFTGTGSPRELAEELEVLGHCFTLAAQQWEKAEGARRRPPA